MTRQSKHRISASDRMDVPSRLFVPRRICRGFASRGKEVSHGPF